MRVTSISVFPIKSLRGVAVPRAEARTAGFRHDRRWMLVDEQGRFISQRQHARLALADVALEADGYRVSVGGESVTVPERFAGPPVRVSVWDSELTALLHPEASRFFSDWLGAAVRLVHLPDDDLRATNRGAERDRVSFADGYPYLLIGSASLDELNRRLAGEPLSMARFRPNLVFEGGDPHAEDDWQRVRVGEVGFRAVKPCDRCVVTTIDPLTGEKGAEPLRTLAQYRKRDGKVWFGVNLCPDGGGTISLGDPVVPG